MKETVERTQSPMRYCPESARLSLELAQLVPGGVNSPFRSFEEVGGHTVFLTRADGSKVYDVDGNVYLDYLGAWGPAVLGHCHPEIIAACQKALADGPVFGAPHMLELEFAQALTKTVPSCEQVRFVNSGTEAVMSAVRLARGFTGKDKVIMFEGCYHGHSDATLASKERSSSTGIPNTVSTQTLLVEFNNLDALEKCLQENRGTIAAIIIEPVAGSMNVIPPADGYLAGVRKLASEFEALLIFDEVLTGFRVALGGAQALYNVQPDLTCFGKALAGGMPIGAYGGARKIMSHLLPVGKVYQAGTFSGNPVTMAGGIETIRLLSNPAIFEYLEKISSHFFVGLDAVINQYSLPVQLQRVGAMFGIVFAPQAVKNYTDSLKIDSRSYARFFHYLLEHGVYMPPSSVDAACISARHSLAEINLTISICKDALKHVYG